MLSATGKDGRAAGDVSFACILIVVPGDEEEGDDDESGRAEELLLLLVQAKGLAPVVIHISSAIDFALFRDPFPSFPFHFFSSSISFPVSFFSFFPLSFILSRRLVSSLALSRNRIFMVLLSFTLFSSWSGVISLSFAGEDKSAPGSERTGAGGSGGGSFGRVRVRDVERPEFPFFPLPACVFFSFSFPSSIFSSFSSSLSSVSSSEMTESRVRE